MKNMLKMTFALLFMVALALDLQGKGVSWRVFGIPDDRVPSQLFLVATVVALWLLPSIIAAYRNHHHQWAIFTLNIAAFALPFVGQPELGLISLLGWIACFVWVALPVKPQPPKAVAL